MEALDELPVDAVGQDHPIDGAEHDQAGKRAGRDDNVAYRLLLGMVVGSQPLSVYDVIQLHRTVVAACRERSQLVREYH